MRLFEHVKRLSQDRYPKIPSGGQTGKQKTKRLMECMDKYKTGGMTSVTEVKRMAMDQEAWHNITDQMARQSEENAPVPTPLVKGRYVSRF